MITGKEYVDAIRPDIALAIEANNWGFFLKIINKIWDEMRVDLSVPSNQKRINMYKSKDAPIATAKVKNHIRLWEEICDALSDIYEKSPVRRDAYANRCSREIIGWDDFKGLVL